MPSDTVTVSAVGGITLKVEDYKREKKAHIDRKC